MNVNMNIDFTKVKNVELDGWSDAARYDSDYWCDVFASYADIDGREATEAELDAINDNLDFIHEEILNQLF